MVRVICAVLTSLLFLPTIAMACPGQVGNVIFEDTFADDSGGWGGLAAPDAEIKGGALLLHPNPRGATETSTNFILTNLMFSAGNADYCTEFVLPKQPADDAPVSAGLIFWRIDIQNEFLFDISTSKSSYLSKLVANVWNDIFTAYKTVPAVKLEPDAVNSVRVLAKDGKLTLFVNGTQVKVVQAPQPTTALGFGMYTNVDKATDTNPTVKFTSFKVTTGQ
jgi:hypothetical protein